MAKILNGDGGLTVVKLKRNERAIIFHNDPKLPEGSISMVNGQRPVDTGNVVDMAAVIFRDLVMMASSDPRKLVEVTELIKKWEGMPSVSPTFVDPALVEG